LLGSIAPTPGGLGFVELGLTGTLVPFGATNADAVAATLIYRFAKDVPTLVFGLLAASTFTVGQRPKKPLPEAA
jgi:putative heme transporter